MRRLVTPPMLARHVLAIILIGGFLGLGWWQVSRANDGNLLSWGYAFEWPLFAAFVAFLWYREIRDALQPDGPRPSPSPSAEGEEQRVPLPPVLGTRPPKMGSGFRRPVLVPRKPRVAAATPASDAVLDEYNDYLEWLNANPDAKASEYPGRRRGPG